MILTSAEQLGRDRLLATIAMYRGDNGARFDKNSDRVLNSLAANERVWEKFSEISSDRTAIKILITCVEAEQLYRTFPKRIRDEQAKLAQLEKLNGHIKALQCFLNEETQPLAPDDRLSARVVLGDGDINSAKQGLYVIEELIRYRRRVAQETLPRLGVTQKTKVNGRAAVSAALHWLVQGMQNITGEPRHGKSHRRCDLARRYRRRSNSKRLALANKTPVAKQVGSPSGTFLA
jgi:hypothetical protein